MGGGGEDQWFTDDPSVLEIRYTDTPNRFLQTDLKDEHIHLYKDDSGNEVTPFYDLTNGADSIWSIDLNYTKYSNMIRLKNHGRRGDNTAVSIEKINDYAFCGYFGEYPNQVWVEKVKFPKTHFDIGGYSFNQNRFTEIHFPDEGVELETTAFNNSMGGGEIVITGVIDSKLFYRRLGTYNNSGVQINMMTKLDISKLYGKISADLDMGTAKVIVREGQDLTGSVLSKGNSTYEGFELSNSVKIDSWSTFSYTNIKGDLIIANAEFENIYGASSIVSGNVIFTEDLKILKTSAAFDSNITFLGNPPTLARGRYGTFPTDICTSGNYIYVQDLKVNDWKTAEGWAEYSDFIKPLSERP